ncbi:hypothetical protein CFC21_031458 [Triticum aestivum]|uniref:Importin N-terminal domain-containing protein n=2 Tax=Triticum aestivum TaxID=4565 RepID=A0A9R1EX85_WHEAT|nr:hypothetical protein CFC21_031458 [Triticum aestivum]
MDESIDVNDALTHASNPDNNIRSIGEDMLKRLQNRDLPNFLLYLSSELVREGIPEESRVLAAITLKNSLDSKDPALKDAHKDLLCLKWLSVDKSIRLEIKNNLLMTLEIDSRPSHSRHPSSKVIAEVIARVACMEIPRNQWLDLVGKLMDNMASLSSSLKQATLEVLQYIFKAKIPNVVKRDQVDDVIASVISALNDEVLGSQVLLAALKALHNIFEFTKFEDHDWRGAIEAVFAVAYRTSGTEIPEAAFEYLVAIASTCHTKFEPDIEVLMCITTQALNGDVESLKVQCIKLWITICEKEIDWLEEEEEEEEEKEDKDESYFTGPLYSLVPLLLQTYLNEEERDLEQMDIWIISMTCLGLAARILKGGVVPTVMHFVEENMNGPHKIAALSPLGFILEGPSVKQLAPLVDLLLALMEYQAEGVRGRAAWTLGRLFELVGAHRIMRNEVVSLDRIMELLIERSCDVPQVSIEVHGALYFLARGYGEDAKSRSKSN